MRVSRQPGAVNSSSTYFATGPLLPPGIRIMVVVISNSSSAWTICENCSGKFCERMAAALR